MTEAEKKELMDAIAVVRGAVNEKNVEVLSRVDKIEQLAQAGQGETKSLRAELDALKAADVARSKDIETLRRDSRIQRDGPGGMSKERSLELFGALCRKAIADHIRSEIPERFRNEEQLIRSTIQAGATTGSYLVPEITEAQLIEAVEEVSDILGLTDFIPGLPAASKVLIPVLTARPSLTKKRATIDTDATASDPTFGQLEIAPDEAYVYFPVDNRLLQMAALPLGQMLMNLLRDSAIEGIVNWLINGDGTSDYNSITGILHSAADFTVTMDSGKDAFADITIANLRSVKRATLKRGRGPRGRWLMTEDILGVIEDLDRSGKYPVIKELTDGTPQLLRNPVLFDEGMPDLSDQTQNGVVALAFGDLATYVVGLVGGIQVAASTEFLFARNQTAMRAMLNLDIKRKPVKTLTVLKTAAS